jgi:hypothetical protein
LPTLPLIGIGYVVEDGLNMGALADALGSSLPSRSPAGYEARRRSHIASRVLSAGAAPSTKLASYGRIRTRGDAGVRR